MCVSPGGCAQDRLLACGLIGSTMARGVSGTRRQSAQSGFINRHACMHIFSNTDVNKDLNPLKLFALEIENTGISHTVYKQLAYKHTYTTSRV